MTLSQFEDLIRPVLRHVEMDFLDTSMLLYDDEEVPTINWSPNDKEISINAKFLALPQEEIKFASLMAVLPITKVKNPGYYLVIYLICLILVVILMWKIHTQHKGSYIAIIPILTLRFLGSQTKDNEFTAHLDHVLSIIGDPISARSYLEKKHGPLYKKSFWKSDRMQRKHPITAYLRYGKDERLKAILKSDLTHPIPEKTET